MMQHQVLPVSAVIPPGKRVTIAVKPRTAFRPERITISHNSFPLPRIRAIWTRPLVAIGDQLGRAHQAMARLARVDLYAPRERREYLGDGEPLGDEFIYDPEEDRYYQEIPIPFNRRERLLVPIGRAARRLSRVGIAWQEKQLASLLILDIKINARSAAIDLPADMFSANAFDPYLNFEASKADSEIEITIENGNRLECRLVMAMIGTGASRVDNRRFTIDDLTKTEHDALTEAWQKIIGEKR